MDELRLFGFPVVIDPRLPDDEMRLVSFGWDKAEQRMKEVDSVRVVNLRPHPRHA